MLCIYQKARLHSGAGNNPDLFRFLSIVVGVRLSMKGETQTLTMPDVILQPFNDLHSSI